MPKIAYKEHKFSAGSLVIINLCNGIIEEYEKQGFSLTLRQLYYQLVARGLIPNKQTEYKRLGKIITNARLAGLVDWSAIVDRTRHVRANQHWLRPLDIMKAAVRNYHIDLWQEQRYRPEVWVEKDALVGVLGPMCRKLDVPLFSCRGYPSSSSVWRAVEDRMGNQLDHGYEPVVVHLGDHDPSGIDMTRDIRERLGIFADCSLWIKRIALNMDQVEMYEPPPNPSDPSDSRAMGYIEVYGRESWELDALEPKVLADLVEETVLDLRDDDLWDEYVEKQEGERATLQRATDSIKDKLV